MDYLSFCVNRFKSLGDEEKNLHIISLEDSPLKSTRFASIQGRILFIKMYIILLLYS